MAVSLAFIADGSEAARRRPKSTIRNAVASGAWVRSDCRAEPRSTMRRISPGRHSRMRGPQVPVPRQTRSGTATRNSDAIAVMPTNLDRAGQSATPSWARIRAAERTAHSATPPR